MQNILGIHFGHDGAVCVVSGGRIRSYVQTERRTRIKHAGGVPWLVIDEALRHAQMRPEDVELVTITSTQHRECVLENPGAFSFNYMPNGLDASIDRNYERVRASMTQSFLIREAHRQRDQHPRDPNLTQWPYFSEAISSVGYPALRFQIRSGAPARAFAADHRAAATAACTLPIACVLFGRHIPGFFVDHHAAHCASAFFKSPFDAAVVISADGGKIGNFGGFVMHGREDGLVPVETHEFVGGPFYDAVAQRIGLDAGKLMGLAGHGSCDGETIGLRNRDPRDALSELLGRFDANDLDQAMRDPLTPTGRKLAADAQASFEAEFAATVCQAVDRFSKMSDQPAVCLSGGCALNCPTNTILMRRYGEDRVFIESSCNDEGLAFGSAAWAYVNVLGRSIDADARAVNRSPFQGAYPGDTRRALDRAREAGLELTDRDAGRAGMCEAVLRGEIGAVMRGKSEIGPRALGHRSIIGRADIPDHHARINDIKQREQWRPLAPMVPGHLFARYFEGPKNPYMLATSRVATDRTPAARHADGSARVQVLEDEDLYGEIAVSMEAANIPGVLINTSFNGRDRPLFDDACDAVDFVIRNDDLRYVLIEDVLVRKPALP